MSIPVFRPFMKRKDMDAVLTCLVEDHLGPGREMEAFVEEASGLCGCAGGRALRDPGMAWQALFRTLAAAGVQRVAASPLVSRAVSLAAASEGIGLVLVDTCADLPVLDTALLEGITEVQALVLDHPCGFHPDIAGIRSLCDRRSWILVEDVRDAFCPALRDQALSRDPEPDSEEPELGGAPAREESGAAGPEACGAGDYLVVETEFDSLLVTGGGALLLARSHKDLSRLEAVADSLPRTVFMGDMNAALGRAQLKSLPEMLRRRMELRDSLRHALSRGRQGVYAARHGQFPSCLPVQIKSSVADVQAFARKKGVETAFAFPDCLLRTLSPEEGEAARHWPRAYGQMLRTLLFPLHPGLSQKDLELLQKLLPSLP